MELNGGQIYLTHWISECCGFYSTKPKCGNPWLFICKEFFSGLLHSQDEIGGEGEVVIWPWACDQGDCFS